MSRLLPFLFSLCVIALGAVFSLWLWNSYQKVAPSYEWPEVSATVISSDILAYHPFEGSAEQFHLDVSYRYQFQSESYLSDQVRPRSKPYLQREDAEADLAAYPLGAEVPAWVNPEQADYALLERDSKAMLYAMAFPLLLVVAGLVILVRAVCPSNRSSDRPLRPRPGARLSK